jgi:hypothetical protein
VSSFEAEPLSPNERRCFLCRTAYPVEDLTDEHLFPASIGGELVARSATCRACNNHCSAAFEAKFANSVKVLTSVMGIANRRGDVPSIDVSFRIDGRPFRGVLHSDGELVIQNRREQEVTEHGKVVKRWWLFTNDSFEQLQKKAAKRGELLVIEEPDGRDIEFVPESFMPLDFINSLEAKRTAAKVALTCVAEKLGHTFACLPAFDTVRGFIREGEGDCARLFFNQNFADATEAGPFQHLVILSCDARKHTFYAIVMFFGTMPYLVQLSSKHEGIDFGAHYAYDARKREEIPVFVAHLENERLAVDDVLGGSTRFGDVAAVAAYGAAVIQRAASPRTIVATVPPGPGRLG